MKQSLGIYVHIPFCLKKCFYCDFCSFLGNTDQRMREYVRELCRRITEFALKTNNDRVDTIYFGGGTPTLLPVDCFAELLECIRTNYDVLDVCEITCECNPATADFSKLSQLRRLGINRLSIGLQSVQDEELTQLGRAHTFSDFQAIFEDARQAGFDNISVDLMYGIPNQTEESFCRSLQMLAKMSPEHISAYGLKIEKGTVFGDCADTLSLPDEDTEYRMYRTCGDLLAQYGYKKYEISNFAKESKESRHNLRYWLGEDYVGFGVAAHSCFGGVRWGNSRDLSAFLRGEDITEERTVLTEQDLFNEYVMLRLRLSEGLDCADFYRRFGKTPYQAFPQLPTFIQNGWLKESDGRIFFTDEGFFVSNAILSELLCFD